jgi:hypothetical protein
MVYTKFTGNENEINLNTKSPEFIEWNGLMLKCYRV